ncbi:hypothetical protein SAMN05421753_101373 [Planctomicrobium piriforme]|uniref:Glycosyltransferase RgtA/B/C/D-like domain-containing protein n=1 Tax=Planctomicrobium piriforme TaxID=1576369 RepID=A0A1I3BCA0_9PLAN|nr:hypothetical protein SAMN05421753_101373 [Planctomicrobium piriforme]
MSGWVALLALCLPYVLLLILVPPGGETPAADDFDYSATAFHLLKTGRLVLSDWPAMTLVGHVLWGALFGTIGGANYASLRLSMLALSVMTTLSLYFWCRRQGHGQFFSVCAGLMFAVNPFTVLYEYTFMTDLTGAAAATALLVFCPKFSETRLSRWFAYGVSGGFAYLVRETAAIPFLVVVGIAFCGLFAGTVEREKFFVMLFPAAVLFVAYQVWLHDWSGVPYHRQTSMLATGSLGERFRRLLLILTGLGFQLLPVVVLLRWEIVRQKWRRSVLLLIVLASSAYIGYGTIPMEVLLIGKAGSIPFVRVAAGWVSIAAAAQLLILWTRLFKQVLPGFLQDAWKLAPILSLAANILLMLVTRLYFDRYLLSLLPLAILVTAQAMPPNSVSQRTRAIAALLLLLTAVSSFMHLQHHQQRQQKFWSVAEQLHAAGIEPRVVDGGLTYAGWYRYTPAYRGETHQGPYLSRLSREEFEMALLGLSPYSDYAHRAILLDDQNRPGYRVLVEFPYDSWSGGGKIVVAQRDDLDETKLPPQFLEWVRSMNAVPHQRVDF